MCAPIRHFSQAFAFAFAPAGTAAMSCDAGPTKARAVAMPERGMQRVI